MSLYRTNLVGKKSLVSFQIQLHKNGSWETLDIHRHQGDLFIEAVPGARFLIKVVPFNVSGTGRIGVYPSIDGLSVLANEPADYRKGLMVIEGSYEFTGWRVNARKSVPFKFSENWDKSDSVATAVGSDMSNTGVIGIAVFSEYYVEQYRAYPSVESPVAKAVTMGGRGILESASDSAMSHTGEAELDPVGQTSFRRATTDPVDLWSINYGTAAWLRQKGIYVPDREPAPSANPWPGMDSGYGDLLGG